MARTLAQTGSQDLLKTGRADHRHTVSRGPWSRSGIRFSGRRVENVSDSSAIEKVVDAVIAADPANLEAYRGRKEALSGFFVGQVVKPSQGKAKRKIVNEVLKQKLSS